MGFQFDFLLRFFFPSETRYEMSPAQCFRDSFSGSMEMEKQAKVHFHPLSLPHRLAFTRHNQIEMIFIPEKVYSLED